jgi:hypothetical protein
MRLTQNEIIQAQRNAARGTPLGRAVKGVLMLLPRPIRFWVISQMMKMAVRAMKRRGYTRSDIDALFGFDNAQRKRGDA